MSESRDCRDRTCDFLPPNKHSTAELSPEVPQYEAKTHELLPIRTEFGIGQKSETFLAYRWGKLGAICGAHVNVCMRAVTGT